MIDGAYTVDAQRTHIQVVWPPAQLQGLMTDEHTAGAEFGDHAGSSCGMTIHAPGSAAHQLRRLRALPGKRGIATP